MDREETNHLKGVFLFLSSHLETEPQALFTRQRSRMCLSFRRRLHFWGLKMPKKSLPTGKVKPTKSNTARVQRERLHARSGANHCCALTVAAAGLPGERVARAVFGVCSA